MIRRRFWASGLGMAIIAVGIVAAGVGFYKLNHVFMIHRLERQGYKVDDLSMAFINKHPFWCSSGSSKNSESVPLYTFHYTNNGGGTGFACEQGWAVYAWPNTDYSLFN